MNEPIDIKNRIDHSQDFNAQQNKAASFGGGKYRIDYDRHQNPSVKSDAHEKRKRRSAAAVISALVCLAVFILCGVLIFKYFANSIRQKIDSNNENYSLVACYESTENKK